MTLSFWGRAFLSLVTWWRLKIYLLDIIEILLYILKYQKTVFSIHLHFTFYSSALPNEQMKAPFRFVPSFLSFKIGGFLYVCRFIRLACHSSFPILREPVYIYVYREDFLKQMKVPFIYIQSCTYYIGVVCETSVSFHAQVLYTCIHLQTHLLLICYKWMSEGSKFLISLHRPIFKKLRSWQINGCFDYLNLFDDSNELYCG